jgi:hypothetical protein
MSWHIILEQYKRRYTRNFVVCEERYEREYIINLVMQHFSRLSRSKVEAAVDSCCLATRIPRARETFIECLKAKLSTG